MLDDDRYDDYDDNLPSPPSEGELAHIEAVHAFSDVLAALRQTVGTDIAVHEPYPRAPSVELSHEQARLSGGVEFCLHPDGGTSMYAYADGPVGLTPQQAAERLRLPAETFDQARQLVDQGLTKMAQQQQLTHWTMPRVQHDTTAPATAASSAGRFQPGDMARYVPPDAAAATVKVNQVLDDGGYEITAPSGAVGRLPGYMTNRIRPLGEYEPESKPYAVSETAWRGAHAALDIGSDVLEEKIGPDSMRRWKDLTFEIAQAIDAGDRFTALDRHGRTIRAHSAGYTIIPEARPEEPFAAFEARVAAAETIPYPGAGQTKPLEPSTTQPTGGNVQEHGRKPDHTTRSAAIEANRGALDVDQAARAAAALDRWWDDGSPWAPTQSGQVWTETELAEMHDALGASTVDDALQAVGATPGDALSDPEEDVRNRSRMGAIRDALGAATEGPAASKGPAAEWDSHERRTQTEEQLRSDGHPEKAVEARMPALDVDTAARQRLARNQRTGRTPGATAATPPPVPGR